MTSLENRPNTALVVIDVQKGVVADAYDRDRVIANIATLVRRARAADVPVIWVQHSDVDLEVGSEDWEYVPELRREEGEMLVGEAHTTEDTSRYGAPPPDEVIAHTNLYWSCQRAPGRRGETVQTTAVGFGEPDVG